MMIQKLNHALYMVVYRLKGRASEIVIEDYDDAFDAIAAVVVAVFMSVVFGSAIFHAIGESALLVGGLSVILVSTVYLTTVHAIAFWYYMTEPTEVDGEWVVVDG